MEKSTVLMEERNETLSATTTQSQGKILALEQEKVRLTDCSFLLTFILVVDQKYRPFYRNSAFIKADHGHSCEIPDSV